MGLLTTGWVVAATVCVCLALVQLLVWLKRRHEHAYLLFSLTSLAAAGVAVAEIRMSQAASVDAFVAGFKLANYCLAGLFVSLAWFIIAYTGTTKRLLAWITTGTWLLGAVINAMRPLGLALAEVSGLEHFETFWGEPYVSGVAQVDTSKLISDTGVIAVLLLAAQTAWAAYRSGEKHQAVFLGSIGFFMGFALIHTTLVDLGIFASPYLISFSFVAIVLVISYELAARVASAATLSEKIRAEEERWRSLLEEVDLLVARIGTDGVIDFANPYFCAVSGYDSDELIGRHVRDLLPGDDRDQVFGKLEEAFRGRIEPSFEAPLATKDGERRIIIWRTVLFQGSRNGDPEVLTVGADVTERREAEGERDRALAEIAELKSQLEEENLLLKQDTTLRGEYSNIVGESEALKYVLFRMEQVAPTDSSVLIQGETGVGKELVAREVHLRSQRSAGPFIRLNCAALPPSLVESELFGHVPGAFTDARDKRIGRFELADGGTLFLDEVSELPLELQPKLLRVLQDGEFEPVGSSRTRRVDVRLVAATNRNLEEEIAAGRFREDLFYRLHVYPITVPPLRDRKQDIPELVEYYLPQICARTGKQVNEVPPRVLRAFQEYSWPGNVRQLQNVLEEAVVTSTDGVLRVRDPVSGGSHRVPATETSLKSLAEAEREHIARVLEATEGQIAGTGGAAEMLDLHPNTLRSRMKKLGLSSKQAVSSRGQTES